MTWWLQLRKICNNGALTFFVHKIARVNWGKFWIGQAIRLVYAEEFWSAWLVSCFQSRPMFSFVSFQTACCLQLLWHTPAPRTYPGWEEKFTEQGGSKRSNGFPDVRVETFVHLKERRGHKMNCRFNEKVPYVWTLEKLTSMKLRVKFHHSTRSTGSMSRPKIVSTKKRTASGLIVLCWTCFQRTGEVSAYSTESLIVSFKLHLKGLQQVHLFCNTCKTPLSPTIRQSSLYQRGHASSCWSIQRSAMARQ